MNQKMAQVLRYWFDLRQHMEVTVLLVSQRSKKLISNCTKADTCSNCHRPYSLASWYPVIPGNSGLLRSHVIARYFRHQGDNLPSHVGGESPSKLLMAKFAGGESARDPYQINGEKTKKKSSRSRRKERAILQHITTPLFQHTLCRATRWQRPRNNPRK